VATPIDWRELGQTEPQSYTLASVPRRLGRKQDPWRTMDRQARPYGPARERLDQLRTAKRSIG
jgi:bifunctional non-homologous end joining protein LigD